MFILSYILNVLITELPLDDRYKKLRSHFTIERFVSLFYYPMFYLFRLNRLLLTRFVKARYLFVFLFSIALIVTHIFGYTLLNPFLHFAVFSILIICFFTDLEHEIIPNEMSLGLIVIGLVNSILTNNVMASLKGLGLVILVFSCFSIIMLAFGQSHAFGAGDIKLCMGIAVVWAGKFQRYPYILHFCLQELLGLILYSFKNEISMSTMHLLR